MSDNRLASDRKHQTLCPICECGWGVEVDEDGCCGTCGACAYGDGVDTVALEMAAKDAEIAALKREVEQLYKNAEIRGCENNMLMNRVTGAEKRAEAAEAKADKLRAVTFLALEDREAAEAKLSRLREKAGMTLAGLEWCRKTAWSDDDGHYVEDVNKKLTELELVLRAEVEAGEGE